MWCAWGWGEKVLKYIRGACEKISILQSGVEKKIVISLRGEGIMSQEWW